MACGTERSFATWFGAWLSVILAVVVATGSARAEKGFCSRDFDFKPKRVVVGDLPVNAAVYFYCGLLSDASEKIKVSFGNVPKNGVITPSSSLSNKQTKIQLLANEKTKPGLYTISTSAAGSRCASYSVCNLHIEIAPSIDGLRKFWWFNGHQVENSFPERTEGVYTTKLTAKPAGETKYQWAISAGSQYAELADGLGKGAKRGTSLVTDKNEVYVIDKETVNYTFNGANITATGQLPPQDFKVKVTVTVAGAKSDPHEMVLKRPAALSFSDTATNPEDSANAATGYRSLLKYKVVDTDGNVLPGNILLLESFNTATQSHTRFQHGQALTSNWVLPDNREVLKPGGSDPSSVTDKITGMSVLAGSRVPVPLAPKSDGSVDPDHFVADSWYGAVTVGGPTRLTGVVVAKMYWIRFRDHGRHCNLQSPPEDASRFSCSAAPFGARP